MWIHLYAVLKNKHIRKYLEDLQQFEKHGLFSSLSYCKNTVQAISN